MPNFCSSSKSFTPIGETLLSCSSILTILPSRSCLNITDRRVNITYVNGDLHNQQHILVARRFQFVEQPLVFNHQAVNDKLKVIVRVKREEIHLQVAHVTAVKFSIKKLVCDLKGRLFPSVLS